MKPRLIITGGFLGAGKTTLLWEGARKLSGRGTKVGLITNDQAVELVDTALLAYTDGIVEEVSGSCFCCNFNGFTEAIAKLADHSACDVIIAEPVGSCTDLSSTILQPLKDKFKDDLVIAPLSVLVDPNRLNDILIGGTSGLHESAAYILAKQLEEADVILISKSDLLKPEEIERMRVEASERWPLSEVRVISSKTGDGFDDWLDAVMSRTDAGTHIAEVDYDIYAEGEAVLGWYNGSFALTGKTDWITYITALTDDLSKRFAQENAAIGHLKLIIRNDDSHAVVNLTGNNHAVTVRGSLSESDGANITINARVQMSPDDLEQDIEEALDRIGNGTVRHEKIASKCLSPGRPNPTYRYDQVL